MATSNFSGFDDASNSWFWNGNKTTADRYRYELSRQQETTLKQVNDLITREAAQVVAPAAGFSQQEYGGFLRQVVPTLLDQYGRINATGAIQFYDQSRDYWLKELSSASQGGRDARRTAATRFATARTRSAVAVSQGYAAQFADTYDTVSKSDAVVNFAMKVRAKSGHAPSVEAMQNALTREVASYHRDTILFNSALDPYVQRVQRVAQATACEFCRLMALGSTTGKVRVSTYAAKFHSHCHCTIQPLFDGEQPIRPDYYDKFEKEYAEASKSGGSAKSILAKWRANAKVILDAEPIVPIRLVGGLAKDISAASSNKEVVSLLATKHQKIDFGNLGEKTWDLENVKDAARTLDGLLEKYPAANLTKFGVHTKKSSFVAAVQSIDEATAKGLTISNIDDYRSMMSGDSHYATRMVIDQKYAVSREKIQTNIAQAQKSGFNHAAPEGISGMDYTITHEFGHVIDKTLKEKYKPEYVKAQFLEERGFNDPRTDDAIAFWKTQTSGYGRSNNAELFAETFADWHLNGAKSTEWSQWFMSFIEDELKKVQP